MRKTMLLIVVVTALLLTSCTKGNRQTAEAAVPLVEAEESREQEQEMENEAAEETGRYESAHVSLLYSPDVLEVHETAVSNNGETYLITLTERGTDEGAFPRLDILSVKMTGVTEAMAEETGEFDLDTEFSRFVKEILCAYYMHEGEADSSNTLSIEMREVQTEANATEILCSTQASIAATNGIPAMNASIEMRCEGEDGIIIILLVPEDVSDPVIEELQSAKSSIQYR